MNTGAISAVVPETKARRGDLVVITTRSQVSSVHGPAIDTTQIALGRVSGVTRKGLVTRYETPSYAGSDDREKKVQSRDQVQIVSADVVDVKAALAEYRKHTWRATAGTGSDSVRPYDSLNEARAMLRRWRHKQP